MMHQINMHIHWKQTSLSAVVLGSVLTLTACTSAPQTTDKSDVESIARPLPKSKAHPAQPVAQKQRHGVRVIFPSETNAPEGSWVGLVKDGQPYREKLVRHASARMCAIRLQVLCYKNGIEADLDPPFAVTIYQPDIQVQAGNVRCGVQKF